MPYVYKTLLYARVIRTWRLDTDEMDVERIGIDREAALLSPKSGRVN